MSGLKENAQKGIQAGKNEIAVNWCLRKSYINKERVLFMELDKLHGVSEEAHREVTEQGAVLINTYGEDKGPLLGIASGKTISKLYELMACEKDYDFVRAVMYARHPVTGRGTRIAVMNWGESSCNLRLRYGGLSKRFGASLRKETLSD